jgi:transcription-repair coupling factor (superfamily II helicase)
LKASVSALRSGREPDLSQPLGVTTEINLHVPALLPALYCNDVHERLVIYKRLASAETPEEIDSIQEELVDRFGPTPESAQSLLSSHRLRLTAKALGVAKIDAGPERTTVQFVKQPPFDPGNLILLVQKDGRIRFHGQDRIRIERGAPLLSDRVAMVKDFLGRLN